MCNLMDADKSRFCFADAFDVDFELQDDVWDDIDDEKLVFASNFDSRDLGMVNKILCFLCRNYFTGYYLRIIYYSTQ